MLFPHVQTRQQRAKWNDLLQCEPNGQARTCSVISAVALTLALILPHTHTERVRRGENNTVALTWNVVGKTKQLYGCLRRANAYPKYAHRVGDDPGKINFG